MDEAVPAFRRRQRRGAAAGTLGSLLVHGLVYALLAWAGQAPLIDFELQRPTEIELGLIEQPASATPATDLASDRAGELAAGRLLAQPPSIGLKARPAAADGEKPARPTEKPPRPTEKPARPRPPQAPVPEQSAALTAFAPQGAQIALRVHMARIRGSELAPEVRGLLEAIPDWRMIVEGSGLDPLHDLERLYVASADLRRSSLVIAGEYRGGVDIAQNAVAKLAAARGTDARWRTRNGIAVAPWASADQTERVIALIAAHQFVITRARDLPRVLQVARGLVQRSTRTSAAAPPTNGDALLGLGAGEAVALSVEGVRNFVRGNAALIPDRIELSAREDAAAVRLQLRAHFASADNAQAALRYWERKRNQLAGHPLLAWVGMREPLADARLRVLGDQVAADTRMTLHQAQLALGLIRSALPPSDQAGPVPSGTLPARATAVPQHAPGQQPARE